MNELMDAHKDLIEIMGESPRQFSIFAPWENIRDALNIRIP